MCKARRFSIVAAVICGLGIAAPAAFADTFAGTAAWHLASGTGTGAGTGIHAFSIAGGNLVSRCTQANDQGMMLNGHTARTRMRYSGCLVRIAGIDRPATVTPACDWTLTLTHGSYNSITGSSFGTVTSCGTTTISVPSIACSVTVPSTIGPVSMQNLQNGTAQASPANQLRVTANVSAIHWAQTGCPGVPANGTDGLYSGTSVQSGLVVWP